MRSGLLKAVFAVLPLSFFAVSASATPVNWTLSGVTFDDGGTASGAFTYDASLDQYLSINLTTTTGITRTGANFQFLGIGAPPSSSFFLALASNAANLSGTPGFALSFAAALTNAGGTVSLAGTEASCVDANCSAPTAPQRFVNAGSVLGTPVGVGADTPEPTSVLLLGVGGAVLGLIRHRGRVLQS